MPFLRITEVQADHLADALEAAIEDGHEMTVGKDEKDEEFTYGSNAMRCCRAMLSQIDEDNPILDAKAKAGLAFDWEQFWKDLEDEPADEDEEDAPAAPHIIDVEVEPVSVTKVG